MSFSPDQAQHTQERSLSLEEKDRLMKGVVGAIEETIKFYEPLYVSSEQVDLFSSASFTKERFERFKQWMNTLSEEKTLPKCWELNQTKLEKEIQKIERLYRVLLEVRKDQFPASKILWNAPERPLAPGEFYLDEEEIPWWDEIPAAKSIKDRYLLDWIWSSEFREGRPLVDPDGAENLPLSERQGFSIVDQDLETIGYGADDPEKRQLFLDSMIPQNSVEKRTAARLLCVEELIERKKKQDPQQPDSLTTKELFELFDEEGVRPATLLELLAYAKTRWKPSADPSRTHTLSLIEQTERADVNKIYALGSIFSSSDEKRSFISLEATGERELESVTIGVNWDSQDYLLIFRKDPPNLDPIDQFLKTC